MNEKEDVEKLEEIIKSNSDFDDIQDKIKEFSEYAKKQLLMVHPEYCAKIFPEIKTSKNKDIIDNIISGIDDDVIKAKIILSMPVSDAELRKSYYNQINDKFLRACITISSINMSERYATSIYEGPDISKLAEDSKNICEDIDTYLEIQRRLQECKDEKEKVELLTDKDYLKDIDYKLANNIKQTILYEIKDEELRLQVIESMENKISPEIVDLNKIAQTMILDFFQKQYGGKIPPEKMERILLAFNKNDVIAKALRKNEVVGNCDYTHNTIGTSSTEITIENIATLIHEYEHAISNVDFLFEPTDLTIAYEVEEGMADIFSEIVCNSYLREHPDERIKFNAENGEYISQSGYVTENSIVRTLLYPLEEKGIDIEAVNEYVLGEKNKFFEMTLSEDVINLMPKDQFGRIMFDTKSIDINQLYNMNKGAFLHLDKNSQYCRRNNIIEGFEEYDNQTTKKENNETSQVEDIYSEDIWMDRMQTMRNRAKKIVGFEEEQQNAIKIISEEYKKSLDRKNGENQR